jgi:hypothetical protein
LAPDKLYYETKHRFDKKHLIVNSDLELQPFELTKGAIKIRVIPYTINDIGKDPRKVKTIKVEGISLDKVLEQISQI